MEKCRGFLFIYTPLIIMPVPWATDPISFHDGCISQSSKEVLAKRRALNKATIRGHDVKFKIKCHNAKWCSSFPFDFCCNNWCVFGLFKCSVMCEYSTRNTEPQRLWQQCSFLPHILFNQGFQEPCPGKAEVPLLYGRYVN